LPVPVGLVPRLNPFGAKAGLLGDRCDPLPRLRGRVGEGGVPASQYRGIGPLPTLPRQRGGGSLGGREGIKPIVSLDVEIVKIRRRPEFLVHAEMLLLGQQTRNVAVGIVEVAEMQRISDAGVDAGWRRAGVDAGRQAAFQAEVDAIDAEGAFLG